MTLANEHTCTPEVTSMPISTSLIARSRNSHQPAPAFFPPKRIPVIDVAPPPWMLRPRRELPRSVLFVPKRKIELPFGPVQTTDALVDDVTTLELPTRGPMMWLFTLCI